MLWRTPGWELVAWALLVSALLWLAGKLPAQSTHCTWLVTALRVKGNYKWESPLKSLIRKKWNTVKIQKAGAWVTPTHLAPQNLGLSPGQWLTVYSSSSFAFFCVFPQTPMGAQQRGWEQLQPGAGLLGGLASAAQWCSGGRVVFYYVALIPTHGKCKSTTVTGRTTVSQRCSHPNPRTPEYVSVHAWTKESLNL